MGSSFQGNNAGPKLSEKRTVMPRKVNHELSDSSGRPHREWAVVGGIIVLITIIFVVNVFVRHHTYLSSPELLATRLSLRFGDAPMWSLWGEGLEKPYAYRFLFRFLAVGLARLLHLGSFGFWLEYITLSYALTLLQALLLYFYCHSVIRLLWQAAALAVVLTSLSFTGLFAYEFPVWVVEDTLAYVFLLAGLIALSKRKDYLFQLCVVLGVLTRETLLLLLVVRWVYVHENFLKKLLASVPALLVLLIVRLSLGPWYDPLVAGSNLNFSRPVEAVIFVFATFGVLWFIAPLAWRRGGVLWDTPLKGSISVLMVALILLTSLLGGRLRETRLVFLAFPWVVVPSAVYLTSWLEKPIRARTLVKLLGVSLFVCITMIIAIWILTSYIPAVRVMIDSPPLEMTMYLLASVFLSGVFVLWQIVERWPEHVLGR